MAQPLITADKIVGLDSLTTYALAIHPPPAELQEYCTHLLTPDLSYCCSLVNMFVSDQPQVQHDGHMAVSSRQMSSRVANSSGE